MNAAGIPAGSDFAYEVGIRALEAQSRRVDSLDTKCGVILAVDGVLAGLLFGSYQDLDLVSKPIAVSVTTLLLLSFLAALRAFSTREYAAAPKFQAVSAWIVRDEEWLKWRFLGNIQEAELENSKKLERKVRWLWWSVTLLFGDVCLTGGYLIWTIAG